MSIKVISVKKAENTISLNAQEVGVLISALNLLDTGDEYYIAKDYGSAPSLLMRLKEIYDTMDQSEVGLINDPICEPSY